MEKIIAFNFTRHTSKMATRRKFKVSSQLERSCKVILGVKVIIQIQDVPRLLFRIESLVLFASLRTLPDIKISYR